MLWMPLNWSILFVSLVVAESRKTRADHELLCTRDKNRLLLSLLADIHIGIRLHEIIGKEIQEYKELMRPDSDNTSSNSDKSVESSLSDLFPNSENIWSLLMILFSEKDPTKPEESERKAREVFDSIDGKKSTDYLSSWRKYTCSWRIGCLVVCLLITLKRDYFWKRKLESVSRMDVSVQCSMVDWPEQVSFVPYYASLREDDLETDALGRKCPHFYSAPGDDKKYELIRVLSKHLAVGEAIDRVGLLLGLTATNICIIKQDYRGDSIEIAYQCLKKWTEIRPSEGRGELEDAIERAGLGGILRRVLY